MNTSTTTPAAATTNTVTRPKMMRRLVTVPSSSPNAPAHLTHAKPASKYAWASRVRTGAAGCYAAPSRGFLSLRTARHGREECLGTSCSRIAIEQERLMRLEARVETAFPWITVLLIGPETLDRGERRAFIVPGRETEHRWVPGWIDISECAAVPFNQVVMLEPRLEPPTRAHLFAQAIDEPMHKVQAQTEHQDLGMPKRVEQANRERPARVLVERRHLHHVPAVRVDVADHLAACRGLIVLATFVNHWLTKPQFLSA